MAGKNKTMTKERVIETISNNERRGFGRKGLMEEDNTS
jgi:hypothetical protein